jgi:hypothetical protein
MVLLADEHIRMILQNITSFTKKPPNKNFGSLEICQLYASGWQINETLRPHRAVGVPFQCECDLE